jgi:hypothetical protein
MPDRLHQRVMIVKQFLLDKQKRHYLYFVITVPERRLMFCPRCGLENPSQANYCTGCGAALSEKGVITPGVGAYFGRGWRNLRRNFADLFLAVIVYLVLNIPVGVILGFIVYFTAEGAFIFETESFPVNLEGLSWEFQVSNSAFSVVYYLPLLFGLFFIFLAAVRGEKVRLVNIFTVFQDYPQIILVTAVYVVVTGGVSSLLGLLTGHLPALGVFLSLVWAIFLIVIICKLAFVPLLLVDRRMKALDAVRTSWTMSRGHEWKVFVIGLLAALMFAALAVISLLISLIFIVFPVALLIGLTVGVIGAIFLSMWLIATYASLYHAVSAIVVR